MKLADSALPRTHSTPSGRRCRAAVLSPDSQFCLHHKPKEDPAAELTRDLDLFRSASDVTVFLSRLITTLSRDQISTRRAAVLSYIAVSLMHSLRALEREHELSSDDYRFDPLPIPWAIPEAGQPAFANEHEARAYFAEQYAAEMRNIAKESLSDSPPCDESPLIRFRRLSS